MSDDIATTSRKPGRPRTGTAMSSTERSRQRRERDRLQGMLDEADTYKLAHTMLFFKGILDEWNPDIAAKCDGFDFGAVAHAENIVQEYESKYLGD